MIFSILPLLMNQNYDKKLLVRKSTFLLCFLSEQSEWSEDVSSHTTRLVYIIIPVECVAQRREINQFVQSDILHSVFVLAPAVDQPSLYKCNVVKPWKIWSKCVVPCMYKISLVQKHKYKHCFVFFVIYFIQFSLVFPHSHHSIFTFHCLYLSQMRFTAFIALMQWVATLAGYYWFCRLDESIICLPPPAGTHCASGGCGSGGIASVFECMFKGEADCKALCPLR